MLFVQDNSVEKVYIARVMGKFSSEPIIVNKPVAWDPKANMATVVESSEWWLVYFTSTGGINFQWMGQSVMEIPWNAVDAMIEQYKSVVPIRMIMRSSRE